MVDLKVGGTPAASLNCQLPSVRDGPRKQAFEIVIGEPRGGKAEKENRGSDWPEVKKDNHCIRVVCGLIRKGDNASDHGSPVREPLQVAIPRRVIGDCSWSHSDEVRDGRMNGLSRSTLSTKKGPSGSM